MPGAHAAAFLAANPEMVSVFDSSCYKTSVLDQIFVAGLILFCCKLGKETVRNPPFQLVYNPLTLSLTQFSLFNADFTGSKVLVYMATFKLQEACYC